MSYIGNDPEVNAFTIGVNKFNGTGACTQFTLTRSISDVNAIEVVVNGVQQEPTAAYTVTNGVITFDEAPSSGTNNIVVTYRAPIVVTFNQVTASQLQANSVTQTAIASGAVINSKIADSSITGNQLTENILRSNNIVNGQITGNLLSLNSVSGNNITTDAISSNHIAINSITGNLIPVNAISGNNIVNNAIRGNNIVAGQITSNLISAGAITGNLIPDNAIRGNNIVAGQITGNLIGTGSISSNHYAGGGVTSDVLSANLSLSTIRVAETVNVVTTAISGNYNIHIGNTTSYYFVSNTTGSVTFNLIANTGGNLNDLLRIGQTASVAIALKQGATRYRANVHIDNVNPLSNVVWLGASQPAQQAAQGQSIDTYTFTVIKIGQTSGGSGGGLYTVFASNTTFASANGQGMGPGGVQ